MSLFDEQIRRRIENDQETLEDAIFQIASVVLDKWSAERVLDRLLITKNALDEILKHYHEKPAVIPEDITDPVRQLEAAFRPSGLMMRDVTLDENWYRHAYGPMLGYLKEEGMAAALIPGKISGYWYTDPKTGKKTRLNKKTASLFQTDALCFYRPLPSRELGIPDLIKYLRESMSGGDLLFIILATLALTLVGMLEPRIYNLLTGTVMYSGQVSLLFGIAVFLFAAAFTSQMIGLVRNLLMSRLTTKTSLAVESSVMMRVLMLPVGFFRKYSSGELSNRVSAVNSLCKMIIQNVLSVGLTSLMSLLYITQIFSFAPSLVLPSIGIIAATVVISIAASFVQVKISRERMQLSAKESGMSYAMLNGIQKIKLTGAEKRAFSRWARLYAQVARFAYNPPAFLKLNTVIITGISVFGTVLLYYLAVQSQVGVSQYYAFNAAYGRVTGAFMALAGIATTIAEIRPVMEMAEPVLKTVPEVTGEKEAVKDLSGSIELSHVTFRYEENQPYIMKDLSFRIEPEEYVAVVGRTGCGKSTLVRLLLGFEKPETGTILYDRYEVGSVDHRSLRKQIGVVMQDGQLMTGNIFSNITIAAPDLSLDAAWEAAEIAGIADDIKEMPMGMHTVISEGEGGISGGQKQRLMIARAIAPKPRILIFDEATSALDNKTQKQVSDALDQMHCTRIVIAHRLSTIQNCDRILMLDGGTIIEEGTYDELIERNGAFTRMVARQQIGNKTRTR